MEMQVFMHSSLVSWTGLNQAVYQKTQERAKGSTRKRRGPPQGGVCGAGEEDPESRQWLPD